MVQMVKMGLKEKKDQRVQLDQSVVLETQGSKEIKEYKGQRETLDSQE